MQETAIQEPFESELERRTLAKVSRRLLPLMFALYVFCMLDRLNVSFAALGMQRDLHLSESAYGAGAGIFFIGYMLFEVPSNLLMERFGARRWIARITFSWGIIAALLAFVHTAFQFSAVRFILGIAEAGFFPGMVLYTTYWFPIAIRGRAVARFILANVAANIVGGPVAAMLVKLEGVFGLHGWQWLFLVEGIASFAMGFVTLAYMTDRPAQATWLADEERDWLSRRMAAEQAHRQKFHHMTLLQAFKYPRVIHLCVIFFLNIMSGAALTFFGPKLLKERSAWPDETILWLWSLPAIVGAVCTLISAHYSDRSGNHRRLFVASGMAIASVGLVLTAITRNPVWTILAICATNVGTNTFNPPFWALTSGFLSGAAAAGGIAFINSIGNSGSYFGSQLMGSLKQYAGHGYELPLFIFAGTYALSSLAAFLLPKDPAQDFDPSSVAAPEASPEPVPGH